MHGSRGSACSGSRSATFTSDWSRWELSPTSTLGAEPLDVHEIQTIEHDVVVVGAGGAEGSLDASNIFKPSLARGELRCIGATTLNEYRKYIEKDGALDRRFQTVMVEPPSEVDTIKILKGLRPKYEEHHKLEISDEAIDAAVILTNRYVSDKFQPDKSIDLIEALSAPDYALKEGVAYAHTTVNAKKKGEILLLLGSNDDPAVWVNNKEVHRKTVARGVQACQDIIIVPVKEGKNDILIKIVQRGGGWGLNFRISDWRRILN